MMRYLKLLLAVNAVLLAAIASIWWFGLRDDPRATHGNDGLRGSIPPRGQVIPDLAGIVGITPAVPTRARLAGSPALIVATCFECQSGDIIGGAMRRLADRGLPRGAQVHVVGWEGDAAAWRRRWSLPVDFGVHAAGTPAAQTAAKSLLKVDETGYAYLYDSEGVWRSSFPVQLMQSQDIVHDMRRVD